MRFNRQHLSFWLGSFFLTLLIVCALVALIWNPDNPTDTANRFLGSSWEHWFGTDRFGRDIFVQMVQGAKTTVMVGLGAVAIAMVIGVPLGIHAGLRKGKHDEMISGATDVLMAFPTLLLALLFAASFGVSTFTATIAVGIAGIATFVRIARAGTYGLRGMDYIHAAKIARVPNRVIAVRHIFPNILSLIIVEASQMFGIAVLSEAALSYLGLGTPPPIPSWGRMLQEAQGFLETNPHYAFWPGLCLAVTVLASNLFGEGLRDILDSAGRGGAA